MKPNPPRSATGTTRVATLRLVALFAVVAALVALVPVVRSHGWIAVGWVVAAAMPAVACVCLVGAELLAAIHGRRTWVIEALRPGATDDEDLAGPSEA